MKDEKLISLTEQEEKMLKGFNELPKEVQHYFLWCLNNIDFVKGLCKGKPLPSETLDKYRDKALEDKDYFTYTILGFKEVYDKIWSKKD